ncbi:MAG: hypothetical protein WDN10_03180 [bacterium]
MSEGPHIPERKPHQEQIPSIDFLDENLKVSFELAPDVVDHLPKVSGADAATGTERYGALLGSYAIDSAGQVNLQIKGVYQETEEELTKYGSYKEGVETVSVDLGLMRRRIEEIQERHAEYRDFHLIGDVHTHPASGIPKPSLTDLQSVIRMYESGDVASHKPYVFGIGAKRSDGEMEYWFYRIIKTDSGSGYGYKALEHA